MSVAPNLCCDETKNQGTDTRMTLAYSFRQQGVQVQVLRLFYPGGLVFHWYAIYIDTGHEVQSPLGG